MATVAEIRGREVDRDEAGRLGWSETRVDAELPVLFADREWEIMASDPAFGYVCRAGHRLSDALSDWLESVARSSERWADAADPGRADTKPPIARHLDVITRNAKDALRYLT